MIKVEQKPADLGRSGWRGGIRWTGGGFGMAAHNYDGDMLTDEIAQVRTHAHTRIKITRAHTVQLRRRRADGRDRAGLRVYSIS